MSLQNETGLPIDFSAGDIIISLYRIRFPVHVQLGEYSGKEVLVNILQEGDCPEKCFCYDLELNADYKAAMLATFNVDLKEPVKFRELNRLQKEFAVHEMLKNRYELTYVPRPEREPVRSEKAYYAYISNQLQSLNNGQE